MRRARPPVAETLALAGVAAYAGALAWLMRTSTYDVWAALVVAPLLVLVNLPLLHRAVQTEVESRLRRMILWAFALRLVATVPRYLMAFVLYKGVADARGYVGSGGRLADQFSRGDFSVEVPNLVGTGFVKILTAVVFVFTGTTTLGGFLVFACFAFWGTFFFYRAVRTALPAVDAWNYGRLVFFLPSILFWPSSVGKEAWMTLCLGLGTLGAARLYVRAKFAFVPLALSLAGAGMVRPHMAVMLMLSAMLGFLVRPAGPRATVLSPVMKLAGFLMLFVLAALAVQQAAAFFKVDQFTVSAVDEVLTNTQDRTSQDGSSFTPTSIRNPLFFPLAVLQVLVRPFPWEARNPQAVLAAAEGLLLVAVAVHNRRRLLGIPRQLKDSFVLFATVYSALFVVAFSTFGNFGLIARERVQVLPMVLVLLCLPDRPTVRRGGWPAPVQVRPVPRHLAVEPVRASPASARPTHWPSNPAPTR